MSPIATGIVGIGILLTLMFAGMRIGIAMLLVGSTGFVYLVKLSGAIHILASVPYGLISNISSSSIACALTIGLIAIPEMRRYKYGNALAAGSVAAGGTLDILIPPSGLFIIYGIMTEQSIGKLFIAGMIPGIILALMFIVVVYIWVRLNPTLAPPGSSTTFRE